MVPDFYVLWPQRCGQHMRFAGGAGPAKVREDSCRVLPAGLEMSGAFSPPRHWGGSSMVSGAETSEIKTRIFRAKRIRMTMVCTTKETKCEIRS